MDDRQIKSARRRMYRAVKSGKLIPAEKMRELPGQKDAPSNNLGNTEKLVRFAKRITIPIGEKIIGAKGFAGHVLMNRQKKEGG